MNSNKKTNINFIYNLIYEIVIVLSPLIVTPYISRVLGVELVGVRSYTFAILAYFELLANLGIAIYGQREIAKLSNDKEARSRVFFSLQALKTISFITILGIYCCVFFGFGALSNYKVIFAIWIIHLSESFCNVTWYFQGIEKFRFISIRGIIIRVTQIIITIVFVKSTDDFYLYLIIYAVFPLIQGITLWPFLVKSLDWKQFRYINIKEHIGNVLIFFIPTIAVAIYSNVDKVMLGGMLETTIEAGYYESAQHIALLCTTIFTSLYTVMRSRISIEKEENSEKLQHTLSYFIRVCLMLVLPIVLGILAVSDNFVLVFFGDEYEPVIGMLRLFVPVIAFMGISGFISAVYIVPYDKQKYLSIFYIISTILNVVLNLILIPSLYAYGAIIGSIVAESVVLIGCIILSRRFISPKKYLVMGWKYILSSLVMFGVVFLVDYFMTIGIWQLFVEILIGVISYGIMLIMTRDEIVISFIKKVFYKNKKIS